MATLFTHPLVAIALLPAMKLQHHTRVILLIGIMLTLLPDADVLAFRYGIPYEHWLGHRGLSHSLFFAAVIALILSRLTFSKPGNSRKSLALFYFLCLASHGLLDAMTNGGLGVAFFSPFSNQRYFLPFRPVEVATLNIKRFFTPQGLSVLKSELLFIWLPAMTFILTQRWFLKKRA